ncbi:hypothetical protein AVEN_59868-1 [Araneus ventricosus]|uniref:Uncharacterized protein n=1 Tax=Araneus ventricosus TaxID=182803 RepID=A0A4Y2FFQ9_ARAVE|nr:hypothetical protein AVEN_59868-1 [Araneus ventricosus]
MPRSADWGGAKFSYYAPCATFPRYATKRLAGIVGDLLFGPDQYGPKEALIGYSWKKYSQSYDPADIRRNIASCSIWRLIFSLLH